jgi:hypothetical protein
MKDEKYVILMDATLGDDANDGVTAPVKSLERVGDLIYSLEEACHVEVKIARGRYFVPAAVQLYADAMKHRPLSLSFLGDGAVFTGARPISGADFTPVEGKPYYRYQMEPEGKSFPHFRTLYVNGKMQTVAHQGYLTAYEARQAGTTQYTVPELFEGIDKVAGKKPPIEEAEKLGFKLYLPEESVAPLPDGVELESVEFHLPIAWYYRVLHIRKVDKSDRKGDLVAVYFRPDEMRRWGAMHNFHTHYYFLQNALEFVDEPGEYFYNRETGELFYYPAPGVDLATATVEIPTTEHMLSLFGFHNVTFRGVTFTENDNRVFDRGYYAGGQAHTAEGAYGPLSMAALFVRDVKGFTMTDCTFRDIASTGVKFFGIVEDLTITDCRFLDIGMTAVDIGAHSGVWGVNDGFYHKIENVKFLRNLIDGAALLTRGSIAFYMSVGREVEIAYNTIRNTSYTCISVGWRWGEASWKFGDNWHLYHVDIHHNYFTNFMTGQADGGTIYTLGGNVENGYHDYFNYMHDNFVWYSDACWDGKGMIMPYYHDGASSNWHTHHNAQILYPGRGVHAAIYLQNILSQLAHNILVEKNDIVFPFGDHLPYAAGAKDFSDHTKFKSNKEFDKWTLEMKVFGPDWNKRNEEGVPPSRVDPARDLVQKDTYLYDNPTELPADVIARCAETGAPGEGPDMEAIIAEMQAVYDAYYAAKSE